MKYFLALVMLFQVNQTFAYNEYTLKNKIDSLNTTFVLQSNNFYSELDKMYKLGQDPNADSNSMYTLYTTTSQSLCIAVLTVEKTKSLIDETPQIIGSILTKDNIKGINSTADAFKKFLKEFELNNQQCKDIVPYSYDSIDND